MLTCVYLSGQISHQHSILITHPLAEKLLAVDYKFSPLLVQQITDDQRVNPSSDNMSPHLRRPGRNIRHSYSVEPEQIFPAEIIHGDKNYNAVRHEYQRYFEAEF